MSKYSLPEFYKAYSYLKRMKNIENANAFLQIYFCEQQDFLVFRAMNNVLGRKRAPSNFVQIVNKWGTCVTCCGLIKTVTNRKNKEEKIEKLNFKGTEL